MWTIYKLTNKINNKVYIGQTCQKPEDRWNDHRRNSGKLGTPLSNAIEKYGWNNFDKEIIDYASSLKEANEKEQYWIEYYQCATSAYGKESGYNITLGGQGVSKISPIEQKEMLKLWKEGNNVTQISITTKHDRHIVSRILQNLGITEEDFKERKGFFFHTVYVFDIKGKLIETFPCLLETKQKYNYINSSQIEGVLHHRHASTHNLIFLYEEDLNKLKEHIERTNKSHRGKIKSINIITKEEKIYNTTADAFRDTGIDRHTIRNRINKQIIKDNIKWEDIIE